MVCFLWSGSGVGARCLLEGRFLKILVLVKLVPSSEARIRIAADGRSIDSADVEFLASAYDEYAVEAALQLKEKFGGEVVAVSAGPEKAAEMLRKSCLALGVDRGILLRDPALDQADTLGTARALAAACRRESPDLVLCGKLAIDQENSAVGQQVAALLDLPHVAVVSKLEAPSEASFVVHREIEGGMEELEVDLPAVLTTNKGLNEPRYASLKGIMSAKKKPLDTLDLAALGLDPGAVTAKAVLISLETPPVRADQGRIIQGESAQAKVAELVRLLREEAKVL
jgi:electron transfer flavoprotein beta subunit